ncbi:MAG: hypothetical protein U0R70_11495 [Solirubrobacteraceae bacterium]
MSARARAVVAAAILTPSLLVVVAGAAPATVASSRAAAAQAGLAAPPGKNAPLPSRCRPGRARLCAAGDIAPSRSASAFLAATARRGLGIRSGAALIGRRAARGADARLRAALGAPLAAARRTAQAGPPAIADRVDERTSISRRSAAERRWFRWQAQIDRCPDPGAENNNYGRAKLVGHAVWTVTNDEPRRGGAVVRTIVRLDMRVATSAASDWRANLAFVGNPGERDDILMSRQVLVIRKGTSRRAAPTASVGLSADLLAPGLSVQLKSETFDAFVARLEAQERGEPAPDAGDGPIVGQAWKDLAKSFAQMVASRSNQLAKAAEANWRTPNRCLGFSLEGPASIRRGQRVELTGRPVPGERGGSVSRLLGQAFGSSSWTAASAPRGGVLESLLSGLPLPESRPWIGFTAPGASWPKSAPLTVEMTFASKAGIAATTKTFEEVVAFPQRFEGTWTRVLTAPNGYRQTTTGTAAYVRNPIIPVDAESLIPIAYDLESGSVTWTASGSFVDIQGCTQTFGGTGTAPVSEQSAISRTRLWLYDAAGKPGAPVPEPRPFYYAIDADNEGLALPRYEITRSGPLGCAGTSSEYIVTPFLRVGVEDMQAALPQDTVEKTADITLLQGHRVATDEFGNTTDDTWTFHSTG